MTPIAFDPSNVLSQFSLRDAIQLTELLMDDLRRNRTQLQQAMTAGNVAVAARSAHSLASVAANAGCDPVCALAAQVELALREDRAADAGPQAVELAAQVDCLVADIERWRAGQREGAPSGAARR